MKRICNNVQLTRESDDGEPHMVFRETDLESFREALDKILDISSNLDDNSENLLCEKQFLDFGAGRQKTQFFSVVFFF